LIAKDYFEKCEAWEKFAETSFSLQGHYQLVGFYEGAVRILISVINKKINDKITAKSFNYLGMLEYRFGRHKIALKCYLQSLEMSKKNGDLQIRAMALNNLAQLYQDVKNYTKAKDMYTSSLEIIEKISDFEGEGRVLNNLGTICSDLGEYKNAEKYWNRGLKVTQKLNDTSGEAAIRICLGTLFYSQNNYPKAMKQFEQALKLSQGIADMLGVAASFANIASLKIQQGFYEEAINPLLKSFLMFQELNSPHVEVASKLLFGLRNRMGEDSFFNLVEEENLKLQREVFAAESKKQE